MLCGDDQIRYEIERRANCPDSAIKAWDAWSKVADQPIYYRRSDGYIRCDWTTPDRQHNDGLEDAKKYVKAFRYLPNLLLRSSKISLKPNPDTCRSALDVRNAFDMLQTGRRKKALWLEYYVLHDLTALTELGFKFPRKRQYVPGKVTAALFDFVKEVWVAAKVDNNPICQWLLSYDSPAQVWFGLSASWLEKEWNRIITPGATQRKSEWYEEKLLVLKALDNCRGIKINFSNKEILSFHEAFAITQIMLRQSGFISPGYYRYLDAHRGEINYVRKGGTKDGGGVQRYGLDADTALTIGTYEIETYLEATRTATLAPKKRKNGFG